MRTFLIILLLIIATVLIVLFGFDLYMAYFVPHLEAIAVPAPIGVEAGPIKVNIGEETPWISIVKLMVTVLGTYLGIKVINKYVK